MFFFFSSWHFFLSLLSSGMDSTAWTQNALPWNTHNALVDALLCLDYRCWTTEGHQSFVWRAGWPWPSEFLQNSALIPSTLVSGVRIQSSLPAARLPTGQKIFWQRLFPFSNDYDFVLFGTSVGFMLVLRLFDCWDKGKTGQTKPIKHLEDLMML